MLAVPGKREGVCWVGGFCWGGFDVFPLFIGCQLVTGCVSRRRIVYCEAGWILTTMKSFYSGC